MHILLLRPSKQGQNTAQRLIALGHSATVEPVLELRALEWKPPLKPAQLWLVTSANSFAFAGSGLQRLLAQAPPLYYAPVGRQAAALAPKSLPEPLWIARDGEDWIALFKTRDLRIEHALYWAGAQRNGHIERFLASQNIETSIIETYLAEPVRTLSSRVQASLIQGEVDAILHYSPRSAAAFVTACQSDGLIASVRSARHFCLSPAVAEALAPLPAHHCAIARTPDETALLALLEAGF